MATLHTGSSAQKMDVLCALPPDVSAVWPLLEELDGLLLSGFARLSGEQRDFLGGLQAVFDGTPLATPLREAAAAIVEGRFSPPVFTALAQARAGLLGAIHDALLAQAGEVLGRQVSPAGAPGAARSCDEGQRTLLDASGHFLSEVAIAGLARLDASVLEPFEGTLTRLQEEAGLFRLASLLTGFTRELHKALPVTDRTTVPLMRWADLWTRAMLLAAGAPPVEEAAEVEGSFVPLGVELRSHSHASRLRVWGLLKSADGARVADINTSRWKVEVICGNEEWRGYKASEKHLLGAIEVGKAAKVKGAAWPGGAISAAAVIAPGAAADLFAEAACLLPGAGDAPAIQPAPPFDRHPIQIAIPIRLDEAADAHGRIAGLPVRVGAEIAALILPQTLQSAIKVVALLRFDAGGWYLAPLAVQTGGKKPALVGAAALLSNPKLLGKQDRLAVLKEKSKYLLRKKAGR